MKITKLVDLGKDIWVFVLTGGPCGGKSTALALLVEALTAKGYKVLIVHEAATKVKLSGVECGPNGLSQIQFQEHILRGTINSEEDIFEAARQYRDNGRKVVVICDRGVPDGAAYMGQQPFDELVTSVTGHSIHALSAERYHAAFHLQTAAIGATSFYTNVNNPARKDNPEEAAALDVKTFECWRSHPHVRLVENGVGVSFQNKIQRVLEEVFLILGDPIPLEREDKFLVNASEPIVVSVPHTRVYLEQDYLVPADPREEERVRMWRSSEGEVLYYHTHKVLYGAGVRIQRERLITQVEYTDLLRRKDWNYDTIKKDRLGFFWKQRYFEVDNFIAPEAAKGLVLMELEHIDATRPYELPPFIKVVRKVTGEKEYSNHHIARRFPKLISAGKE